MPTTTTQRPLENGWLADTPVDDSLLRRFVHNQADVNEALALAVGGRADRAEDVFLADSGTPVPYFNQAILARPVGTVDDPVLDVVDAFFADSAQPSTVLSIWPTPDFGARGWTLVGHPMMVVRAPGVVDHRPRPDVDVRIAATAEEFATAERIAIDGYPLEGARGLGRGQLFPPRVAEAGLAVRLGLVDGEPVALGNLHVGHGVTNLCLGATLPAARRRGVWEALVWARISEAPDLPAVAYTSDDSRPGFVRMGFLPLMRFTFWAR